MDDFTYVRDKWILDRIVCADAKTLSSFVRPDSVALTVTSPPYRNAIDYQRHVRNLRRNSREYFRGNLTISLEDYLTDLERIFGEVYKVTIEGGLCCIVIGNELSNGVMLPLPALLLARLLDSGSGWNLHEEIIWNKVTGGRNGVANRFSVTVQHPHPLYYYANIMHEHILVLRKGAKRRAKNPKAYELPINDVMKKEIANSIWNIAPVPPNSLKHPAPFPEQIPWRLIQLYTYPGEVVLDPFNGSGQTTKVAKVLKRHYIGVDIENEYVKIGRRRLNESLHLSKNLLVPSWQKIEWQEV
jgi:site-specific DNA-methyltransferase (adenine-specific)